MSNQPKTIIDKIWKNHVVIDEPGSPAVLYNDLHLIHEVTSPQAFSGLRERGLTVKRPSQTIATMDHSIPTTPIGVPIQDAIAAKQIATLEENCREFGIQLFGMDSPNRGIVHVIGPELGLTQPGMTIVCGDSHTATHGAFGALAFGIGTSEVGTDEAVRQINPIQLTLESAIEFIADDEIVEITPKNIRLRKRFLKEHDRKRAAREEA